MVKQINKNKIEVHVRSIFLQGLLLKNEKTIPKKFKKWKNIFRKWDKYCDKENISKLQACINFIKFFKKISYVVVGFEDISQIKKIIEYFNNDKKKYTSLICGDTKLINPRLW